MQGSNFCSGIGCQSIHLAADGAVLTQEAGELTVDPGSGIHERLDWCDNSNLSWLPAKSVSQVEAFNN